ncbi:MAG TPA: Mur ligase family protein, partial [Planctomycetota bacterium]
MHGLDELWAELDRRTDYESCRRPRGARFDLEGMRSLLARLGDPQAAAPAIHVAGSKGKGTTCHYLEKGLRAAGLRTGLYTSPHLTSWRERICIGGDEADDATVAGALEKVLAASRGNETFFDLLTATAFVAFAERDCAAWVVEVGLGGRFDSTNLLQPLAAAVVSIEAEHVDVFGSDPCAIAVEKAGIFKTGARLWSGLVRGHAARGVL